jgi:hypothetical protein
MRSDLLRGAFAAVATAAAVAGVGCATAHADPGPLGCPTDTPPPSGANTRQVDINGTPATLWVTDTGLVGLVTPGGSDEVLVTSASPIPLQAVLIDAKSPADPGGNHQLIVSDGRGARLYAVDGCAIRTVLGPDGTPFVFDLQNLRGHGTGVGCSDLGDGRRLVGLQALPESGQWVVHRTEIDLDGTRATIGRADTVTAASAQDPAVTSAQTISCGDVTIADDGVEQPQ